MPGTPELLEAAGYEYRVVAVEDAVEPEASGVRFTDLHPGFSRTRLAGARLYRHQVEALEALGRGENVVLVSGTGSGKTEAWFAHVARAAAGGSRVRVIAVYPTLALAWDQLARLEEYASALGLGVARVDSLAKREVRRLRAAVKSSLVTVTNPAMLLQELKKHLVRPGSSTLSPALEDVDLLVVDELDYYGPREVALLLGMIELVSAIRGGRLQVAVLTATLANPEELASYLEGVTGRRGRVVRGRPFHPQNRVIVVLGKDLEGVRRRLLEAARRAGRVPPSVLEALRDPSRFAEEAYTVVDYFRSLGFDVPSISVDPVEILSWYALDRAEPRGVTLAFTNSINEAERLARQLRERLGREAWRVASHHHLVPKEERRRVEEAARRGEVRVIVTPRTLVQGIDIGTVVRVVHVGLPVEVREYRQREGRKGRRPGIPYTESVIIPWGRWDSELLRRGLGALREWVSMPLERVWVNPGNHYKALLTGAAKLVSRHPALRGSRLTGVEEEALRAAGVLGEGGVDQRRLQVLWRFLNFYEYGPPYGVKRVLEEPGGSVELEQVGRCDLVEKFQPGCFDYANDAVVVRLVTAGSRRSTVTRVVEWRLRRALAEREPAWLMEAVEEYRHVKSLWGEDARLLGDVARGMVSSEAETVVYPPRRGFGLLRKVPYRCVWSVARRRPRAVVTPDGRVRVFREKAFVHVPGEVAGEYRDYTYGVEVEAPPGLTPDMIRLGLATLNVYLRRARGLPLGLLKYSVYALGGRALVEVHEEEAAGVLPGLDWLEVAEGVRGYEPGPIDDVLLLSVDEYAFEALAALGFDWEAALDAAARVAEALASRELVEVRLAGVRVRVPRPSRSLRLGALAAIAVGVELEGLSTGAVLAGVAYYDGSRAVSAVDVVVRGARLRPPRSLREVEALVEEDVEYEGFKLLAFGSRQVEAQLREAGLAILARLASDATDVYLEALEAGLPLSSPEWIAPHVEVEGEGAPRLEGPGPEDAARAVQAAARTPLRSARPPRWVAEVLSGFLEREAKATYIAHLALQALAGGQP